MGSILRMPRPHEIAFRDVLKNEGNQDSTYGLKMTVFASTVIAVLYVVAPSIVLLREPVSEADGSNNLASNCLAVSGMTYMIISYLVLLLSTWLCHYIII